jgi:hypothetical protein
MAGPVRYEARKAFFSEERKQKTFADAASTFVAPTFQTRQEKGFFTPIP